MCVTYLLKFSILLCRVSVIKPHDQFPIECLLIVLVQQGSFSMTNMEVPKIVELM